MVLKEAEDFLQIMWMYDKFSVKIIKYLFQENVFALFKFLQMCYILPQRARERFILEFVVLFIYITLCGKLHYMVNFYKKYGKY